MIGITGVTGKLGSYVADLVNQQGISSIHLARSPERAKVYASAEIRKMVYANTPEVVEALKGIDVILSIPPFTEQMKKQPLPCLEIMPRRKPISRS